MAVQSHKIQVPPSGEAMTAIMARRTEAPPYEELINFPRAKDKDTIQCVMCGLAPGPSCCIPKQNKDVCKDCDKSTWCHSGTSVYFKWCKGCKKFLRLGGFSEKLDAAKCDRCRERGRQSYLVKKGKDGGVEISVAGGRSRSNSISSMKSDFETEYADLVSAAAALVRTPNHSGARSLVSSGSTLSYSDDDRQDDEFYQVHGRSTADDDDLNSARALCSFTNSQFSRGSPSPVVDKTSAAVEEPVVIDDDSATLSSVFGKPLRELKRRASSASPERDICDGVEPSQDRAWSKDVEGAQIDDPSGPVGSALRGTLYELACIHSRVMTLEENAARVKALEATVEIQDAELQTLRTSNARLERELASARSKFDMSPLSCSATASAPSVATSEELGFGVDPIVQETEALAALSAAFDRVQKRPRLVSMGE